MAANVKPVSDHGFIALVKKAAEYSAAFLCLGIRNEPK